ncbi:MAG: phosphotransferase [Polyangiales bacterium]
MIEAPALVEWVARQRWFRSKARGIKGGTILERVPVSAGCELVAFSVELEEGESETYALAMRGHDDVLVEIATPLAELVGLDGELGPLHALRGPAFDSAFGAGFPVPRLLAAEQSNSAVVFGEKAILKVYRKLVPGENPEVEVLRALCRRDVAVPRLVGTIDWGECAFAMFQAFVPNRGDAWSLVLASADERHDVALARTLGSRTAELHRALADAFGIESMEPPVAAVRTHARTVVAALGDPRLTARATELDARIARCSVAAASIRVHGDYHLGQVLIGTDGAPVILDFEGEPTRSLAERRAKSSPFKDVAGMLRSFAYAAATKKNDPTWTERVSRAFLDAWREGIAGSPIAPRDEGEADSLLDLFLLEKALYEIEYERNNRPTWVEIPVSGVLALLDATAR